MKTHLSRAREVFDIEIAGLRAVRAQLDDTFDAVVERLQETVRQRGKVVVVGVGKSGIIGRKIAATLASTGVTSVVLDSVDAAHGDVGIVNDGDLVLILSYSGESEELIQLLPAIKRFSVHVVAITGNPRSSVGRHAHQVLNVHVPREACPFNLAPTTSTTAMLVLGDALALALLDARGLKRSDFARYHPAGAIGRALLLKVSDIMRTGERHPVATESTTVRDGLFLMTRAKAGCLTIINRQGKLAGVFTDGDLRRHMAENPAVLERPLREVMTPRPVCIREDALAAEALKIFNERRIDDLVVVNAHRKPVGLVDSQDLPRMKLM
jgi:arabinose-5-phosphate isomerase